MSARRVFARVGDASFIVDVQREGRVTVTRQDGPGDSGGARDAISMTAQYLGHGRIRLATEGHRSRAWAADAGDTRWVFIEGEVFQIPVTDRPSKPSRRARGTGPESLSAPMPATVVRILVAPGASVCKGDTMVLLEAMKMELPLRAPHDAIVRAIRCTEGDLVQPGVPLIDLQGG